MKRRLFAALFTSVMLFALIAAVPASAKTSGDFEYELLADGTSKIKKYTGSAAELDIPGDFAGYEVSVIGDRTFYGCTSLTAVTVPDSVKKIGDYAFESCTSLASVTFGSGVTAIGVDAFRGCTALPLVSIPAGVEQIGSCAFYGCTSLAAVEVDAKNTAFKSVDGILCSKDGKKLIVCPIGASLTTFTVPDGVTQIESYAFGECSSLTAVTLPDGLTAIDSCAFCGCASLPEIAIPESVTSIGDGAFLGCTSLKALTVDEKNTSYKSTDGVLYDGSGTELILCPVSVPFTSITVPDGVTTIASDAFRDCVSLTEATLPVSVKKIGYRAFVNSGIYNDESNWEDGALYLGNYLIEAKKDISGSFTVRADTKYIADHAFFSCQSLKSVTIPASVTVIGEFAFCDCSSLKSVTIIEGLTSVESSAFVGCSSLKKVYFSGSESNWALIRISGGNDKLRNAEIVYGSSGPEPLFGLSKVGIAAIVVAAAALVGITVTLVMLRKKKD